MEMQRAGNYTMLLLVAKVFKRKSSLVTKNYLFACIDKTVVCINNINIPL